MIERVKENRLGPESTFSEKPTTLDLGSLEGQQTHRAHVCETVTTTPTEPSSTGLNKGTNSVRLLNHREIGATYRNITTKIGAPHRCFSFCFFIVPQHTMSDSLQDDTTVPYEVAKWISLNELQTDSYRKTPDRLSNEGLHLLSGTSKVEIHTNIRVTAF